METRNRDPLLARKEGRLQSGIKRNSIFSQSPMNRSQSLLMTKIEPVRMIALGKEISEWKMTMKTVIDRFLFFIKRRMLVLYS